MIKKPHIYQICTYKYNCKNKTQDKKTKKKLCKTTKPCMWKKHVTKTTLEKKQ